MVTENKPSFAEDAEMERAKAWWKEHGPAIIIGVTIGIAAVVGFNYWQDFQQTQAEKASLLFDRLQNLVQIRAEEELEAADSAEVESESETAAESEVEIEDETENAVLIENFADSLMSNYESTPYAAHAAFVLAKLSVERDDYEKAIQSLQWILDNTDEGGILHIARLRMALVLLAKGEADSVLALLEVKDKGGFAASYQELSGDAYLQKHDTENARSAYQSSLDLLLSNSAERDLIQLKLDNLGN